MLKGRHLINSSMLIKSYYDKINFRRVFNNSIGCAIVGWATVG